MTASRKRFEMVENPTVVDVSDMYVCTERATAENGFNNNFHYHNFYELEFIIDGNGLYDINGNINTAKRGGIFLTTPADYHTYSLVGDEFLDYYCVQFRQAHLNEEIASRLYSYTEPIFIELDGDVFKERLSVFESLLSAFTEKGLLYELKVKNLIENICIDIIADMDKKTKRVELSTTVKSAIVYIKNNYRKSITLGETARRLGLSSAYFSHRFAEDVGVGFSTYVRYVRLTAAANLLKSTELSVKEICYKTGFSDPNYFSGAFKERFGVSPKKYRESFKSVR